MLNLTICEAFEWIDSFSRNSEYQEYYSWFADIEYKRKKDGKIKGESVDPDTFIPGSWGGEQIEKDHWALEDGKSYLRFLTTQRGYNQFTTKK